MPPLSATLTAKSDPMLREFKVVLDASARTGAGIKRNLQGGSGAHAKSGVITETLVLLREMGRGNWSRVPGSLTILMQRLGVLKLLFKDNVGAAKSLADALEVKAAASAAEAAALKQVVERGNQAMATMSRMTEAEILAAAEDRQRAAAATEAAAADRAKAVAARQAATAMEAEGAAAGISLGPVGWLAIALVALGSAAYFTVRYFITLRRETENLADVMDITTAKFTDQAEALRDAALAAQEFDDWLKKLHESESDFAEAVHVTLDAMRERARLEHELAADKGATRKQLAQMDIEALRKEKAFLDKSVAAAKEKESKDEADAKAAATKANDPSRAAMIKTASHAADEAAKIAEAVREKMKHTSFRGEIIGSGFEGVPLYGPDRPANANDKLDSVKVGGKEYPAMSVNEAEANFNKLNAEAEKLIAIQKQLSDLEKDKKELSTKDMQAVKALTKERDRLASDLGLKEEFLPQIADAKSNKMAHGSVNELQRVGAYAQPAVEIQRSQLHVQREIKQLVGKIADRKGSWTGPNFGGR